MNFLYPPPRFPGAAFVPSLGGLPGSGVMALAVAHKSIQFFKSNSAAG